MRRINNGTFLIGYDRGYPKDAPTDPASGSIRFSLPSSPSTPRGRLAFNTSLPSNFVFYL
jgi:hypothetical protein